MHIKIPFEVLKPIIGEARIDIDKNIAEVFAYIGDRFFENYPKWAVDVVEFEPLDGRQVFVGARAKQIRKEHGAKIESIFQITDFQPQFKLAFQGLTAPYKHSYCLENTDGEQTTHLTFQFQLLEVDIFMRPFEKLIRTAIEEGTESTVETIKQLITREYQ